MDHCQEKLVTSRTLYHSLVPIYKYISPKLPDFPLVRIALAPLNPPHPPTKLAHTSVTLQRNSAIVLPFHL